MHILIKHHKLGRQLDERIDAIVPGARITHARPDDAAFDEAWRTCEVFLGGPPLDRADEAANLRWVQVPWSGIWRVGDRAPEHWIITRGAGLFGPAIAEHVWAMLLHFRRHMDACVRAQQRREWGVGNASFVELGGQTMLVLGLGDIGRAVARRAKAFDMRVIGVKRDASDPPPHVDRVVGLEALDEVLPEADVVVGSLPGTPHTRGLLSRQRLALIKDSAGLINVGRGSLIDQDVLTDALREGRIAWAGLDVFDPEPLPADHPLWELENVLVSPHIAGSTDRSGQRLEELFLDNLTHYAAGDFGRMVNVFSRQWGY